MRKKIVLKRRSTPKLVTLPNGTTFTARYERISWKSLPSNIKVTKTRTIGPRMPQKARKKVRFTPSTSLCERLKRIKKYRASRRTQNGSGLASILASPGIKLGSQAITSALAIKNK